MERRSKWQGNRPTRLLYCAAVILVFVLVAFRMPLYRTTVFTWEPSAGIEHIQLDRLEAFEMMAERRVEKEPEPEPQAERAAERAVERTVERVDDLRLAMLASADDGTADEDHAGAERRERNRSSAFEMRPAGLQMLVNVEPVQTPIELTAHADGPPSIGDPPMIDPTTIDVHYPEKARKRGVQGRVILAFLVDKDGRAYDIRILHPLYPACDEAAIEAVRGARFTPGRTNGRDVPALARLAIRFQLRTS